MKNHGWKKIETVATGGKLGTVWFVKRTLRSRTQFGYFKFATSRNEKYVGPLLANELVAYRLARALHLKVAKVKLARVNGRLGIVSISRSKRRLYRWDSLNKKIHKKPFDYLVKPNRLLQTFVFDTWICNVDRHSGNLIAYRKGKKYDFYLIDHGLTLGGAMHWRKAYWDDPYWDDISKYNPRFARGLPSCIHNYEQLRPYIKEIEALPPSVIEKAVESVPTRLLSKAQRRVFKNFLFHRQSNLSYIIKRWLQKR